MRLSRFIAIFSLAISALAAPAPAITPSPVAHYAPLEERAGTTPTPTGTLCAAGSPTALPLNQTQLVDGITGCVGVQALGTNLTRNDIVNGVCKPFTLIFARGTTEDPNLGNLVGPPFVYALNATFGTNNVAVQGVDSYPGSPAEFCAGGSPEGSQNLAKLISQTRKQCPQTKLCVTGYSQGSAVVHNGISQLSADDTAFINSVVLFGDPDNGKPVGKVPANKVRTKCRPGDNICAGGDMVLQPHLSYCHDVAAEAAFVQARFLVGNVGS